MYEILTQLLIQPSDEKSFMGTRDACRYCSRTARSDFGKRVSAHTFPAALGNRSVYSLDECRLCNERFSLYEDSLVKAVGPFLTLGGVRGRSGVRKTGLSSAPSQLRHKNVDGRRHIHIKSTGDPADSLKMDPDTGLLRLRMPIDGDKFVPRYAFKALAKMALAMLPIEEIVRFQNVTNCLASINDIPAQGPLNVGFSFSSVGNSPPALAGTVLRRREVSACVPYTIFMFVAGSVCFQIWIKSDEMDQNVPDGFTSSIEWTSQLPLETGEYYPIKYSKPLQLDWTDLEPRLQPFEAFDFLFNPQTNTGGFIPILRYSDNS